MSRSVRHCLAALAVALCLCSCGREGKVIPRSKFARIYAEMFLADVWLSSADPETREMADTTAFYEPIFKEHGYTIEDYWSSVSYYLQDPDRFSRILKRSGDLLDSELKVLEKEKEEVLAAEKKKASMVRRVIDLYSTTFDDPTFTDRILLERDSTGRFVIMPIPAETLFFGPRLIIPADTVKVAADSLALEEPLQ